MSASNATSSEFIRGQIASIIESGGVSSGANNVGSQRWISLILRISLFH